MKRRALLATAAAAVALPRFAIGQADNRPTITIAVPKIANTGTLDPLREQSSNASERWVASILETPIGRNQQGGLERVPGLVTSWTRIDDRTVELSLRQGVIMHDGRAMTAEDVAFSFGPERMFGPNLPQDIPAVARRHWPALERIEVTGQTSVRFINSRPDVTMEGRLSAGGSEIMSRDAWLAAGTWQANAKHPVGTGPYRLRGFEPDVSLVLDAHDAYWGGRPPVKSIRFLEVAETAARIAGLEFGRISVRHRHPAGPDRRYREERATPGDGRSGAESSHRHLRQASSRAG